MYVLLLIINALLLVLGRFMDMAPLIMVMTPILLPVVTRPVIGMGPIQEDAADVYRDGVCAVAGNVYTTDFIVAAKGAFCT